MFNRLRSFWKLLFRRDELEGDLDAEVQSFYQTMIDRYVAQGLSEQEARRLARLKFNSPDQVKEKVRDARSGAALSWLMRDINYSLRRLRKAPAFAIAAIVTLALGIAANATIFSIVNRFVLHAPPVGDPATLMTLHTTHRGECCNAFPWPLYNDVRQQAKSFSGVAAYYDLIPASVGGAGEPERIWGQAATANFFDVAQLGMTLGRGFTHREENLPVVVLGYGLWQHRFAADPTIAGKSITLSGHPFTVIGVAPQSFRGVDIILDSQFWVPLGEIDQLLPNTSNPVSYSYHWITVIARLHPGVTAAQASAELDVLGRRIFKAHPGPDYDDGFRFEPTGSLPPRDESVILMFLTALTVVALLVLGIAGANVANMFMAQAASRQRETAVRLALGATRWHILHQTFTESLLLSLGGGLFGIAISMAATQALSAFHFPAPVPLDLSVSIDWRVLLYSLALSIAVGVMFGLAPAFATKPVRVETRWNLRNLLVISQIAMSIVLLCATSLFLRSLRNASQIEIGFHSRGILMMAVDPRLNGYSPERTTRFLDTLQERVAALPGVGSATYTDSVPLSGGHRSEGFSVENHSNVNVELYMTGPDYFQTIGTPVISGHDFTKVLPNGQKLAIVNQALADRLFKNKNPLGQRIAGRGVTYQIIGVVKNVKSRFLGEEYRPVLYRSLAQDIAGDPSVAGYRILVQFSGNSAGISAAVRREIHLLDPTLAVFDAQTMQEHLRDALFLPRLAGALFGAFGVLGLFLASVGLYGVINSWVTRRTREIGIRIALGARIGEVQWLIIRQGMLLTFIALIPGLATAWATAKLFTASLYGIHPHDLATFTLVPIFLIAVALFACWIPARRAAGLEPLEALRHE